MDGEAFSTGIHRNSTDFSIESGFGGNEKSSDNVLFFVKNKD